MAPSDFLPLPDRVSLLQRFKGVGLDELPTPAVVIDSSKVSSNCARMQRIARDWGCLFRAHIKTHKTREGVLAQVRDGERGMTPLIVSTLAEAWGVLKSGLIEEAGINDILYGVPMGVHKIPEILELRDEMTKRGGPSADIKVIIDNIAQVDALQKALASLHAKPIQAFVKVDCGYGRAGLTVNSPSLASLLEAIATSSHVALWGLYCHAGHSYGSKSEKDAQDFLSLEVRCINDAAQLAESILDKAAADRSRHRSPLVLSVGATPTAHAASAGPSSQELQKLKGLLQGELELHAGNYPFLDLQQMATHALSSSGPVGHMTIDDCALSVVVTVTSLYPGRSQGEAEGSIAASDGKLASPGDEAMIDAGGIALSKDVGQFEGYGHIVSPPSMVGWMVSKVSQEHGILAVRKGTPDQWASEWGLDRLEGQGKTQQLRVGDKVRIIPQHACMVAAAHHWFFIFDSSLKEESATVQDVWVPWKSW